MIRVAIILLLCSSNFSCAGAVEDSRPEQEIDDTNRVDTTLWTLHYEFLAFNQSEVSGRRFKSQIPKIKILDDRVRIEAVAKNDAEELRNDLTQIGATNLSFRGLYVNCHFPIDRIDELASLMSLRFVRPVVEITYR